MELDDKILEDAMKKFDMTREQVEKAFQEMLDDGLLQKNDDPNMPLDFKLTTNGSRMAEKIIGEDYGEFKKITDHNGISYKVPTFVIMRGGIREDELHHFPLWTDD